MGGCGVLKGIKNSSEVGPLLGEFHFPDTKSKKYKQQPNLGALIEDWSSRKPLCLGEIRLIRSWFGEGSLTENKLDLNDNQLIKQDGKTKEKGVVIKGYQHLFWGGKKKKLREVSRKISWNEELSCLNMKEAQKSLNPRYQNLQYFKEKRGRGRLSRRTLHRCTANRELPPTLGGFSWKPMEF